MKNCQHILFDLDGTLVDSGPSILRIMAELFNEFGVEYDGDLSIFIGPPFRTAFPSILGVDEELTRKLIDGHRERYEAEGVLDFIVYLGVFEALKALKDAGRELYLVSSKLELHARAELGHMGALSFFSELYCQTEDGSRSHKDEVMAYAIRHGNLDVSRCVMVGDRNFDINAANKFGMRSVGILHGYGSYEELAECRPTALVNNMEELLGLLL